MAESIFPDGTSAGGIVYRDAEGNPTNPPDVHNAYAPPPSYVATCAFTALPSNCDARIEPRQINAIVSELVRFAECLDPDGVWDCATLQNLCNAFTTWAGINIQCIKVSDTPPENPTPNCTTWFESDTGILYLYYQDPTSTQWVQIGGVASKSRVYISDIPPVGPMHGELWWESDTSILWVFYDDGSSAQWVQTK